MNDGIKQSNKTILQKDNEIEKLNDIIKKLYDEIAIIKDSSSKGLSNLESVIYHFINELLKS